MRHLPTATRVPANQMPPGWIGNTLTIRLRYILVDVDTKNWIGLVTLDQDGPFSCRHSRIASKVAGLRKGGDEGNNRSRRLWLRSGSDMT